MIIKQNYFLSARQAMLSLNLSLHLFFPQLLIPFIFFIWENLTGPLDSTDVPLLQEAPSGFIYPLPPTSGIY